MVTSGPQAELLEELGCPVGAVASEPAEQLLGPVPDEESSEGQTEQQTTDLHGYLPGAWMLISQQYRAGTEPKQLQIPAEAQRAPAGVLALVEAMGLDTGNARVELEPRGSAGASPALGLVQQALANPARTVRGINDQVLEPCPPAKANRLDVLVHGAEPDPLAVELRDQHQRGLRGDRALQPVHGMSHVPARRARPRRREKPFVHVDEQVRLVGARHPDLDRRHRPTPPSPGCAKAAVAGRGSLRPPPPERRATARRCVRPPVTERPAEAAAGPEHRRPGAGTRVAWPARRPPGLQRRERRRRTVPVRVPRWQSPRARSQSCVRAGEPFELALNRPEPQFMAARRRRPAVPALVSALLVADAIPAPVRAHGPQRAGRGRAVRSG